MSKRPIPVSDEQRQRQREVMEQLWRDSAFTTLTPAAARIGVSVSQLSRYISAETVIPTQYYQAVADTFGLTYADLVRRLLPVEDVEPADADWDFLAELRRALPHNPARAEETYREWAHAPELFQRSLIKTFALLYDDPPSGQAPGPAHREDYNYRPTGT